MLPPLNVTAEVVDTACAILVDVIGELAAGEAGTPADAPAASGGAERGPVLARTTAG
jgi:hypothetical protein